MAADLNLILNGEPVPVYLGENISLAASYAAIAQAAAEAAAELATPASSSEVDAGTDNAKSITPAALAGSALMQTIEGLAVTNTTAVYVRGLTDYPGSGTPSTYTNNLIFNDPTALPEACTMVRVRVNAANAGPLHLFAHTRAGNDMTVVNSKTINVEAGENDLLVEFDIPAGAYIGWAGRFVLQVYAAGGSSFQAYQGGTLAAPDYTDDAASTTRAILSFTCYTGKSSAEVLASRLGTTVPVGRRISLGANDLGATTAGPTTNPFRVINRYFPNGGWLDSIDVTLSEAGAVTVYAYLGEQADAWDIPSQLYPVASKGLTGLSSGANTGVEVGIEIPAGGYVGIYTANIVNQRGVNWLEGGYASATADFTPSLAMNASMLDLKWHVIEYDAGDLSFLRKVGLGQTDTVTSNPPRLPRIAPEYVEPAILFFAGLGQSTWIGPPSGNKYNTRQEYGALSFNGHNFTDVATTPPVAATPENLATSPAGGRDAPLMGAAAYSRERIMAEGGPSNVAGDVPIIIGHAGHGNTPSSEYVKGATGSGDDFNAAGGWYKMMMDQFTAVQTYAGSDPLTVGGMYYYQGQNDAFEAEEGDLATLRSTVKGRMISIADDFNADVQAELSDTVTRYMYLIQLSSHVNRSANPTLEAGWEVAMAHLEASQEPGSLVCVATPEYPIAALFDDNQHPGPLASDRLGALMARAVLTGRKWEPLQVVDSYASGDWIVLVYNRDGLVLDIDDMPIWPNYGFRVFDGETELTSLSITVSGNKVTIDCGEAADGFSWSYGNMSAPASLSPYTGGGGNLRDSAGDTDVWEGWPLHNWAVLQEGTITSVS